ncbi:AMP-binding protein [Streptomyces clavuligerus]|uniref:AMP-binding protein n=1 Tax=Streptomyces clavuligerus TaxID=1901 RepID=UPI0013C4D72F
MQFTSGSTTRPRGVVLSHRAVLAGLRAILGLRPLHPRGHRRPVGPLPPRHGLFGCLAQLLNGGTSHVFDPALPDPPPRRAAAATSPAARAPSSPAPTSPTTC